MTFDKLSSQNQSTAATVDIQKRSALAVGLAYIATIQDQPLCGPDTPLPGAVVHDGVTFTECLVACEAYRLATGRGGSVFGITAALAAAAVTRSYLADTDPTPINARRGEPSVSPSIHVDEASTERVMSLAGQVRAAGLTEAAEVFETAYWGFLRVVSAYVQAHPYVGQPQEGMTPLSALHVVDVTVRHWASLVPGSPMIDDEAVLEEAADDDAWHREEDRRMRRAAGEEI